MKKLLLIIATFALSVAAFGASIDGKWTMEQKSKNDTVTVSFTFKANGDVVNGTMSRPGKRMRSVGIQNGKIDGNRISFETVMTNKKKGDVRTKWDGTISGDQITGRRRADTGKGKGGAFTMKRAS